MSSTITDRKSGIGVSTTVDRLTAAYSRVSLKAPVRVATTASISLSGLQTIDDVVTAANDRVLVKNETPATLNGIYVASTGDWQRAPDWDDNRDVVRGTQVFVTDGTANGARWFSVDAVNPIVVGTTEVNLTLNTPPTGDGTALQVTKYVWTAIAAQTVFNGADATPPLTALPEGGDANTFVSLGRLILNLTTDYTRSSVNFTLVGDTAEADEKFVVTVFQGGGKGWTPQYVIQADGARYVWQLDGYVGGAGAEPTDNVGLYLKSDGTFTATIGDAADVRGPGASDPKNSIELDAGELQLVGDAGAPGNNKVYGTDGAGAKGWKDDPAGGTTFATNAQAVTGTSTVLSVNPNNLSAVRARRNRLVNPAMQISSVNGNSSGTSNGYVPADNWAVFRVTSAGTITTQRVQSVTPKGAKDRIRVTITAADASLAAGEYLTVTQAIVGQEIADFQYGGVSAKQTVLRFLFKGPAGTYAVALHNAANDRSYVALFTPASADTDEIISLVIPGDTSGTWTTASTTGLTLDITLACGSTFQGTTGWQAGNYLGTSGVSNGMGTISQVFEIGEAGLYLDPESTGVAPTWELPSYFGDETSVGVGRITLGTAVASTSGTSIDFTGIPSWAKRVTVMFLGASLSGTANFLIQIGDSGGVETSSYESGCGAFVNAGTPVMTASTAGFIVYGSLAAITVHGDVSISLANSATNSWTAKGNFVTAVGASVICHLAGSKALSAVLDRVRITTTNGTDTFDLGTVNVSWE